MAQENQDSPKLHKNESIKLESNYLRGTLAASIADPLSGDIPADDAQLIKFHGSYLQDDRDERAERRKRKLDKAYSFMIRVRVPGGVATPAQWLALDALADRHGGATLRLTTRQAFQLHGIIKGVLKPTIARINEVLLSTIAACGDVNRNVMCNPNPFQSALHAEALATARALSAHLTPHTRAYHEIWLDEERVAGGEAEEELEPIYGRTYLPRKFKIGIAVPPANDIDVFSQDLGLIAIADGDRLAGYNVTVGGGLGMSHGKPATFPRLGDVLGYCSAEQAVAVAEAVVKVQRDFGDRSDRLHARLKYTIADRGLDWFRGEVEARLGWRLEAARPFAFSDNGDRYGWVEGTDGCWHLTLFIQNGRVSDTPELPLKSGLRAIAEIHQGDFRLTANQNLIIGGIRPQQRPAIEALVTRYRLADGLAASGLRLNSMACVALPTCGLALAESERCLPDLVTELEAVLDAAGLRADAITIRMTGCPNGCARPYLGEIGLVGKAPGKYNIYLGAAFDGSRLNRLYKASVPIEAITAELRPIILRYATERATGERFGDFCVRAGIVTPIEAGANYHVPMQA
jgi:sulfite reductase (NADPH) hemoprotein beta-component